MKTNYFNIPEITISYKDAVKVSERPVIRNSANAHKILEEVFADCMQHHEEFWIMLLNRANRVLGVSCISKCGTSGTIADLKIIMQTVLKANASGIICAHNHPSGNLNPSPEDKGVTGKIKNACEIMNLSFLDNLIISSEGYLSFTDEGLL